MMRIRCTRCMSTFEASVLNNEDGMSYCPVCGVEGALVDIFDPDDYDETSPRQQRLHMALRGAYELSDSLEVALGHPGDTEALADAETALESVTRWMDTVRRGESE